MVRSHYLKRQLLGGLCALALAGAAAAQSRDFNIAAGDLKGALDAYARQSGVQLLYDSDAVQGKRTGGVHGALSPEEALKVLLSGTALEVQRDSSGAVAIRAVPRPKSGAGIPKPADSEGLQEVMVTAQKRQESDQSVPITMTAISGKTLDDQRVQDLGDLSRLVPGLLISTFSENSPTIAIRGASNTFEQMGVSKPVAVVVDDVFVPRATGSVFQLFDLNSIDVLEGPQGTLFGRNITGGAIVIETVKPTFEGFGGLAEASTGNFGDVQFNGLANIPLTDRAAANMTISAQHRDGYGRDILTGKRQDDINSENFRGNVLLDATDTISVLLSADYSRDWNGGRTLSSTSLGNDGNPRDSELGVQQDFARDLGGGAVKMVWQAPAGEVTAISAYRLTQSGEDYSGVGANFIYLKSGSQSLVSDDDHVGTFSQEVRYASPKWSFGDFVTGFYYLNEDGTRDLGQRGLAAITGKLASSTLNDETVQTVSYAGFADATVHILPEVDLTGGLRYTVDQKKASLNYLDFIHPTNSFAAWDHRDSWSEATPRGVLSWHPDKDALLYASVTRGFTAGGFNTDASSPKAFAQAFQPESVTSYEAGAKTQWLDDRLRFDASLFDMKYHDKQELVFNSNTAIVDIVNASSATSKGYELSTAYKPMPWITLTANYARLITTYDRFILGSVNNTGNKLSSSPPNKYTLSADWSYPIADEGYFVGAVNYSWIDGYNTGAAADPRLRIPSYGLVNLSVGYDTPDHVYRLTAWARNLTDKNYILTNSTQNITAQYLGEPRTFGVTLRVLY